MWHWDQGHLPYFQFDALRQISRFALMHDIRTATREELLTATGLAFAGPTTHNPWRQYSRVLKLCLLVSQVGEYAEPTPVARILSEPGTVTCDEYLHFIAQAHTEPSPALSDWSPDTPSRYPLLFTLKYLLAKKRLQANSTTTFDEILGAYQQTAFMGDEGDEGFIAALENQAAYEAAGRALPAIETRQARESIRVLSQISYLHVDGTTVLLSLDPEDAQTIFQDLAPVIGPKAPDRESELRRLAALFGEGSYEDFFDYPNTVVNDVVQSGFVEGSKVKKTHLTIERNQALRAAFFAANPTTLCDICSLDTAATYPWVARVLDLHHLLPLSSGTRAEQTGTTLEDLVAVCPTCHRAIHRYYDCWLGDNDLADFPNELAARAVYNDMKANFTGAIHA